MHRSIHTIPYNHGGPTRRNNLALTCRRHNQTKAGTGWAYRHNPDGTYTWTTATSHTYTSPTSRPWSRSGDHITHRSKADEPTAPNISQSNADPPPL